MMKNALPRLSQICAQYSNAHVTDPRPPRRHYFMVKITESLQIKPENYSELSIFHGNFLRGLFEPRFRPEFCVVELF